MSPDEDRSSNKDPRMIAPVSNAFINIYRLVNFIIGQSRQVN